ncbi:1,4-dihydroxy-2-naphthoate polyprenyltransferase [Salegentibacter mishustinae]|uniref:1,4-dihydroxy-2-naphthoate octaprenyltransferase n=1 Tax=Salegentibacter mishustinae TaxID=270918 RepID=A0A0Q9Z5X2_9FLAO|nr:1,4-dihydroxy-2-naphthoate polyprenyltransferase [Salegentibacter mishustinae]KRG28332.1 1,4-dihydroxy-2-naphthoate octaprenyltransferase [Salegentibacter mishustinae]PNW22267.1 1,4-dihydroxy-2-naphthoate octaprenyltransferase [Salegentibacter mishustinae]PZX67488.1 1,4-dihydroxy-2-naphthoate prenyltransferase [Salegentibacter mishustinae]GGW79395.1 1,4-dihydroxy-2-naphthoate octaprenyltransferase [Salegentibacter mishustinae]
MGKINSWISAARLRTLPLSISGIIVGTTIAVSEGVFNIIIFSLALATTLGLQVLSNFANDYGDGVKGTDNEDRVGPQRALQSGLITQKEMLQGIIITAIVTLLFAILLIYVAFGKENLGYALFFFLLGIAAIAAAIKYTVGKSAYGYRGLGDVFVFIFFGLVAVYGSYFLYAHQWNWLVLLPAFSIGFLSMGVLNLNNMRDRASDEKAGKITLVVKLGAKRAKNYHFALILGAILCLVLFTVLNLKSINDFLYLPAFIPLILHLKRVVENENATLLDPELKVLALSTFATAVLFGLGQIW